MSATAARAVGTGSIADMLSELAGSGGSPSRSALTARPYFPGAETARNFSDAAHYLGLIHGRHEGVVELAAARTPEPAAREWFEAAVRGFARERGYLSRLVAAAGPQPSTPGNAHCEAAVNGQRHAIEMLARSERAGTALGAALALVLDWRAIREVLDISAARFAIDPPLMLLPSTEDCLLVAAASARNAGIERAMLFGAEQIMAQHRALWNLLEARRTARSGH